MAAVILPVPYMPQREQGECLAACAAMMLSYLGRSVNYERLLTLLQVRTGIGAPSSNIRKLAALGVNVIYEQGTWTDLETHLAHNRPCLAVVQTGELPYWDERSDHAVLVVGLDDQFIYLNDPAFAEAPVRVPRDEFGLAWLEGDEVYAVLSQA